MILKLNHILFLIFILKINWHSSQASVGRNHLISIATQVDHILIFYRSPSLISYLNSSALKVDGLSLIPCNL